jgi:hypothetical protein
VEDAAGELDVVAGTPVDEPVDDESPSTEMPLPDTVTGALTPGATCVPEAIPSAPEVEAPVPAAPGAAAGAVPVAGDAAGAAVDEPEDDEFPSTEMPLPVTVTGAVTPISA